MTVANNRQQLKPSKKLLLSCFEPKYKWERGEIGWCATCDRNAKKGTRGYCGPGQMNSEAEGPIIYPNSTNWGFCDPCLGRASNGDMLQASIYTHKYHETHLIYKVLEQDGDFAKSCLWTKVYC